MKEFIAFFPQKPYVSPLIGKNKNPNGFVHYVFKGK